MIAIPANFERTTVGREGARGRAWLDRDRVRRWAQARAVTARTGGGCTGTRSGRSP
ncbi:hypothetical protein AB0N06_04805 [Streptomyces sp. NPDC051020]|uniref:hypothetical protein n=1 Tax=Streptomyces sp. NPDC051020 TaxID=3155409 RepID=UPI00341A5960